MRRNLLVTEETWACPCSLTDNECTTPNMYEQNTEEMERTPLEHPAYSHYYLFWPLKEPLGGQCLDDDNPLQGFGREWHMNFLLPKKLIDNLRGRWENAFLHWEINQKNDVTHPLSVLSACPLSRSRAVGNKGIVPNPVKTCTWSGPCASEVKPVSLKNSNLYSLLWDITWHLQTWTSRKRKHEISDMFINNLIYCQLGWIFFGLYIVWLQSQTSVIKIFFSRLDIWDSLKRKSNYFYRSKPLSFSPPTLQLHLFASYIVIKSSSENK